MGTKTLARNDTILDEEVELPETDVEDEDYDNEGDDVDDPAPYGYLKDGITPRRKPGPQKGTPKAGVARPGSKRPSPVRRVPSPAKRSPASRAKPVETDYRPAIVALMQLPAFGLSMLARTTKNEDLASDGITIALHAPNIAEALNETAKQQPGVAAALDNILKVGPYGMLLAAVLPLGLQIAANHKVIPPNEQMGVLTKEQLAEAAQGQQAA
jgi:hypothetical protein